MARKSKPAHPADRKLTSKEKKVVASLVETYVPVKSLTPEEKKKAYADIQELFN